MKPVNFNFKDKPTNRLFLLLCLVGVVLVAWWAWAAGPTHPKSAIQTSQSNPGQSKLITPSYNPLKTATPVSGTSPTSVTTPDTAVITQPSYPVCWPPRAGIQPDIAYPCNCRGIDAAYPCCGGYSGVQIDCPEIAY